MIKKISMLLLLVTTALAVSLLASGCVIVSDKPLLKESKTAKVPNVSGAFKDEKGQTVVLALKDGTTNTYTLTAPDKSQMTIYLEPLKTADRYMFQMANPAGPEVLLGICQIKDQIIEVRALNLEQISDLSKKHGLAADKNSGKFTPDLKKLKQFFDAAFDSKYSYTLTEIKGGR